MKNIHILPTENSSRLSYNKDGVLELHRLQWRKNTQHIYITNDEEIKDGDWAYHKTFGIGKITHIHGEYSFASIKRNSTDGTITTPWKRNIPDIKKIILTTDQPSDGVQAIDDEFLEWFVKNPSCESVEVICEPKNFLDIKQGWEYEIIIPKEEDEVECNNCGYLMSLKEDESIYICTNSECTSCYEDFEEPTEHCCDCHRLLEDCTCIEDTVDMKQETLEEAAENYINNDLDLYESLVDGHISYDIGMDLLNNLFIKGAKWQQEQDKNMYSDEKEFYKYMAKQDSWKSVGLIIQEFIQLKLKEQDKKLYSEEDLDMFRKFMIQEQNFSKSCLDVFIEQFKKK
jgi:hypothetical protein